MARKGIFRHNTIATGIDDPTRQISKNAWNDDLDRSGMLGFTPETIASASTITPANTFIIISGSTNVSNIAITETADHDLLYVLTSGSVSLVNTASPSVSGDIKLLANVNKVLSATVPTILIRKGNFWYEYGGGITNALDDVGDVTITSNASGEILKWDGSAWINNTLAEANIQPIVSNVSDTEIGYLDGVTSAIQTQINTKVTTSGALGTPTSGTLTNCTLPFEGVTYAINAQTGTTYTFVLADAGKIVTSNNASTVVMTIPSNSSVAYPVGASLTVISIGAGLTRIAQGGGVTIASTGATATAPVLRVAHSSATAIQTATDTWRVIGDIA